MLLKSLGRVPTNSVRIYKEPIRKEKIVSNDINFIASVTFLGIVQGFHEKTINNAVDYIRDDMTRPHKQKQKDIKYLMSEDRVVDMCKKIVADCKTQLHNMDYFVGDDDLQRIWLTIEYVFREMPHKDELFLYTSMFALMADEIEQKGIHLGDIPHKLFLISEILTEEVYKKKKEYAESKGEEYDEYVFGFYRDSRFDKIKKFGEFFMKDFDSREAFNQHAIEYFHKLNDTNKDIFRENFKDMKLIV